jgi:membrane protease YdiL (CAAX protease family)
MVPLINFPLVINAIINGKIEFLHFFLAVILNISVSALIIIMSQNAFTTQWKGKSDTLGVSDLLSRGKNKSKSITPAHAFLGFVMAFLGYGYGSLIIYALKAKVLLFWFSPILFSLIPAILMLQLSKLEISRAFKWESALNTYSIRAGLGAIMLNCFFIGLAILWFPTAGEQNTEELFSIFDKTTLLGMMSFYGIFAVLPAICEEFLFRGVVFQGFRKQYNFLTSMVVSAFLFSVIHFSLFKLPHTFVAGLILAYIYEKKGMVTAILFHFCFNATGVTMALKFGHLFQEMPDNKLLITLLLCVSAIASFWLIRIKSPRSNDNTKNELQDDSQAAA